MLTIYATLLTLLVIGGVFYVVTLLRKLFFFAERINELRMEVLDSFGKKEKLSKKRNNVKNSSYN